MQLYSSVIIIIARIIIIIALESSLSFISTLVISREGGVKKSDWLKLSSHYAYKAIRNHYLSGFETMAEKDTTRVKLLLSTICADPSICEYRQDEHSLVFNKVPLNTFMKEQTMLRSKQLGTLYRNMSYYGFSKEKNTDPAKIVYTHPRLPDVTAAGLQSFLASIERRKVHDAAHDDAHDDAHEGALEDAHDDAHEGALEDAHEGALEDAHEGAHEGVCTRARARKRALKGACERARRKGARKKPKMPTTKSGLAEDGFEQTNKLSYIAGNVSPLPFDNGSPLPFDNVSPLPFDNGSPLPFDNDTPDNELGLDFTDIVGEDFKYEPPESPDSTNPQTLENSQT